MTAQGLLIEWLETRLRAESLVWLKEKRAQFRRPGLPEKAIFAGFSVAIRHAGKAPLGLDTLALARAKATVEGWDPGDWTTDQAARIALLLSLPDHPRTPSLLDRMYQTADMGEAVALQKALPLLPNPEAHLARAREGVRGNIKAVFEAVALRNPYPARHFDEEGWNQMVVKTFFVGSPLSGIAGLDSRVNPTLGRILVDLAYERWAAKRPFSPDLWRCVGPVAEGKGLQALGKALGSRLLPERRAAVLALLACPDPEAARILSEGLSEGLSEARPGSASGAEPGPEGGTLSELVAAARAGSCTWENYHAD